MAIQLLGFPTTVGLPRRTLREAPEALRTAGLINTLRHYTGTVEDLGDMDLPAGDRSLPVEEQVRLTVDAARSQADLWLQVHKPDHLMLTLGGDHTTALGTLWALSRMGHDFDVVWIDAHGDFNIIETSPSGHTHGMVLALATGLMPQFMPAVVSPSALRLWGIRDLDPGERMLLKRQAVEVLTPDQVRRDYQRLVKHLKPNIVISFDIDSVDPSDAPGTMTPVPGGFRRHEALDLVGHLARNRHVLALDIVEFHPDRDDQDITLDLARSVITTALAGQAERQGRQGLSAAAD